MKRWMFRKGLLCLVPLALAITAGCPGPDDGLNNRRPIANTTTPPPGDGIGGGIGNEPTPDPSDAPSQAPSSNPTPTATPSYYPAPTTKPPASPKVGTKGVSVEPLSLELYVPATDPAAGLGKPTQKKLAANVTLDDGDIGSVDWINQSGGNLSVTKLNAAEAMVTVLSDAVPGTYFIRAQAKEDSNMYKDVPVQVRATGQISVIVD